MIRIHMRGITRNTDQWKEPKRFIPYNYVWYVTGGEAVYKSDEEEVKIVPGHLYIMPCNIVRGVEQNPENPLNHLWFVLYGIYDLPKKIIDIDLYKPENDLFAHITSTLFYLVRDVLVPHSVLSHQLEVLVACLPKSGTSNTLCEKIVEYIHASDVREVSPSTIAAHFKYDRSYVSRIFHKNMGVTLTEYITATKLDLACNLINNGLSIPDVARECGYADLKSFSRAFKKYTSVSPGKYK